MDFSESPNNMNQILLYNFCILITNEKSLKNPLDIIKFRNTEVGSF